MKNPKDSERSIDPMGQGTVLIGCRRISLKSTIVCWPNSMNKAGKPGRRTSQKSSDQLTLGCA